MDPNNQAERLINDDYQKQNITLENPQFRNLKQEDQGWFSLTPNQQKMMFDFYKSATKRGDEVKEIEESLSNSRNYKDSKDSNNAEDVEDKILLERLSNNDALLNYLKSKDESIKPLPTSVNIQNHVMEARQSRINKQNQLAMNMQEGEYIRGQRLMVQIAHKRDVREKIINTKNIPTNGMVTRNAFRVSGI